MDVFELRKRLVEDYGSYVRGFIQIKDARIEEEVRQSLDEGLLWPDPLIQLNPSFETGDRIDDLVDEGILHEECARIFRAGKDRGHDGVTLQLHRHQSDAVRTAHDGHNYVLTTGTGSGKSLTYIIPIVDHVLRRGPGKGIQAIVVYPMNALANSQYGELGKFLNDGYSDGTRERHVPFAFSYGSCKGVTADTTTPSGEYTRGYTLGRTLFMEGLCHLLELYKVVAQAWLKALELYLAGRLILMVEGAGHSKNARPVPHRVAAKPLAQPAHQPLRLF